MKILVTGGTGLIGRELGKALVKRGHEITLLTRNPKASKLNTPYPHTAVFWDGEKELVDVSLFENIDGVVHLAGMGIADKRWSTKFKQELEDSRILSTKNLLKHAPESLKFFIGASAIGYYPESDESLNEDTLPAVHFFGQLCKKWEASAYEMLNSSKVRVCHIRTGLVFAPNGGVLEQMVTPLKTGLSGPLGDGQQIVSWIDIEDIVNLYIFALENENVVGPLNGVAPQPVTNKKLTQLIARRISRPAFIHVPELALQLVLGEVATYLTMSQNISSSKVQNLGFKFKFETAESSIEKNIPKLKISETRFITEQFVDGSLENVFNFFSNPNNLEKITPPSFGFKVVSQSTENIKVGTTINYKLWLEGLVPVRWQTLITEWKPLSHFSDLQQKGPYHKWHHTHNFEKLGSGVLMKDQVDYSLPLGVLGLIFAGWKVRRDINKIFSYRTRVLDQLSEEPLTASHLLPHN